MFENLPLQFEPSTQPYSQPEEQYQPLHDDVYGHLGLTDRAAKAAPATAMECFVAVQQGNQPQTTEINADWIRNNFQGQQRQELLDLFRTHHISGISVEQAGRDGNRPVTINFDAQQNIPGVGDFTSLSGTLQITRNGFRITNPRMDGDRISLFGLNINNLEYNTSWQFHFCANGTIPLPGREMCSAIRRALRAL